MTLADFIAAHGGEAIRQRDTGWFLCVDGAAYYMMDDGYHIEYREAPIDTLENSEARLKFVQEKLTREEEEFHRFKAECIQQAAWHEQNPSCCPPAPANAVEQLQAGKNRIADLRQQARDLEKQISKHPRSKARQAALKEDRARLGVAAQQRNEIESVTID